MEQNNTTPITVSTRVELPLNSTWQIWTDPMHVIQWNAASDDWHTPYAENDLRTGGKFMSRMEAKDVSMGFDFAGIYSRVIPEKEIAYEMEDGRKVTITFSSEGLSTIVTETFDPEQIHSAELQRSGWQAILDHFKKYAESKGRNGLMRFSISIQAPAAVVQQRMLDDTLYREWTKPFNEHSHFIGNWDKGSTVHFLGIDQEGNKGGMISKIRENIPGKFVSIQHLGMIKGELEILSGPEVEPWVGVLENYILTENGTSTTLEVCMDHNEDFRSYFESTWPLALQRLKEICEK